MLWLRSLIFLIWTYGLMAICGVLGAPFALWSRKGAYWAIGRYIDLVFWGMRNFCGLTYEVRGEPPEGEVLIASKHQSFLDILIALKALPAAKFIMKRSLIWAPFLGLYALRIGASPVTRGKGVESFKEMMAGVEKKRDAAGQLVIYPQGTRVPPGVSAVYRTGVHAIYQGHGAVCVPVAVNTGLFWPRSGVLRRPGVAVLEFLAPIPPGLRGREFMATLEDRIETASQALEAEGRERFEIV